MNPRVLWALFVVVAGGAVAAVVVMASRGGGLPRVPDFVLTERSGKRITPQDLRGEVWVANFVFTRCKATCPVMMSAAFDLAKRVPDARIVTFSVDPDHDTPSRLNDFVKTNGLALERWDWATGASREEMQRVAHGFMQRQSRQGEEILHSEHFVLVDRYGRLRGSVPVVEAEALRKNAAGLDDLERGLKHLLAERELPVRKLPAVNAGLNATSGILLCLGLAFIKAKRQTAHKACMLGALSVSALFLVSYLTLHHYLGSTPYRGEGLKRTAYLALLISHSVLAGLVVPLAGLTVWRAFSGQLEGHKAIARWTFPVWLYVSVTGVMVYFVLYG